MNAMKIILPALLLLPQQAHAACPDGVLDAGEECDDNNPTDGDGCTSTCEVEDGYQCSVPIDLSGGTTEHWDGSEGSCSACHRVSG